MDNRTISQDRIEAIMELWHSGNDTGKIAEILQLREYTVKRALHLGREQEMANKIHGQIIRAGLKW